MERNANYTLVGFIALITMVALIAFAVWLGRISFARDYGLYDIVFVGPVRGLSQGGEVHFNGIKVGEVDALELDKVDPRRVIARAKISADVPIRTDSFATLEPQGITGLNYIQISAGTAGRPLLIDVTPRGQVPILQTQKSALADLLEGGGNVLTRTVEALDRVNRVLSDRNLQAFSATMADLQVTTAALREQREMFADLQSAIQSADTAADNIAKLAASGQSLVDGDGKRALADVSAAAEQLKQAATDVSSTVGVLKGPATDFATTTLPQVQSSLFTLQEAAESLNRLVGQVEQNPRGLVNKPTARELELAP